MRLILFLVVYVFSFSISSFGQGKYPSTLWEISKPNVSKPSYLFGTYHVSDKGVFKLGDSIFIALKSVDIVAKEVNANTWQHEQTEMDNMELAYYRYNDKLRDVSFSEHTLNRTNTIQKLTAFLGFQPGFVNYYLYRNNIKNDGFQEEMFLDKFISSAGYKYGKEIKGLENYLESNILGIEGQKDQNDLEKREVKKIPGGLSYREMQDKIYDGYLNNNLNAMDSFQIYEFESEAFYNKFVTERNYNQADSIDYYIKTGKNIFAAVGAAHLPGNEGVIEILRKKGYNVRPVQLKYTNSNELEAVKKKIVPVSLQQQNIDGVISMKAPGVLYPLDKSDIFKSYGYADMMNSAYYYVARLYNNAGYYSNDEQKTLHAIDSLLYSSIKGDIVSKKEGISSNYKCIDVTTKVKNKDIERYRFIVTPYEIIRIHVGGKNEYALSSFVDDCFNSIEVKLEQPLPTSFDFELQKNLALHQWTNTNSGYIQHKQRFANYNKANQQLNSLIKVMLPNDFKNKDTLLHQLIRETVLSSEAFDKNTIDNLTALPILQLEKLQKLQLHNGTNMLTKSVIQYPYIYFLSSISKENPSSDFINTFQLKAPNNNTQYQFIDTSKKFKVKLPYQIKIDQRWKAQMDRIKKQHEDDKKPNADKNLFYEPETYGVNSNSSNLLFEDINQMEVINLNHSTYDKELYYPSTLVFWKKILKKYDNSSSGYKYNNYADEAVLVEPDSDYGSAATNRNSYSNYTKPRTKVEQIQYDTTNKKMQTLSFFYIDSVLGYTKFYKYYLSNNNVHYYYFNYINNTFSPFQKMVMNSFEPITNDNINLYNSNLTKIINDYKSATKAKRPNVLNRLNNINVGVSNLSAIKKIYESASTRNVENNILRRKLIDMVASGTYTDAEWISVSKWLRSIFENTKELATLRNFAVQDVINNDKLSDADWLLKNFYNTPNTFQKKFDRSITSYLRNVFPKNTVIPKAKLVLNEKGDFAKTQLIDSGYFTKAEQLYAFNFYKNNIEDEALNIQLSQEKNDFIFNEKEINENLSSDNARSNFRMLLSGFKLFYKLNPKDAFFEDAYQKILQSKSNEDLLQLLEFLLKQKTFDAAKINPIVTQLSTEPRKLYDINSMFFENNHYQKLDDKYKNKLNIAKYYLLNEYRYSKLDSIQFIGVEVFPFNTNDSVYFFKYIKDKEINANIAFIVLDNKNQYLKTAPYSKFTTEQISAQETYGKITSKLMRKLFTELQLGNRNSFYKTYNYSKSLSSEE